MKHDILTTEQIDVYALGVHVLTLPDSTGRRQKTDCANKAILLRLIQSVKSPNAEPFKQWLADLGAAELEKTEDGNRHMRAAYRLKLHDADSALHELVRFRGIVTPAQHQALTDANYAGLYDVAGEADVIEMRELPMPTDDPKDWMGVTEEGYNILQRVLTGSVVQTRNLRGHAAITQAAEDVGVEIRLTIERTGGTLPEHLPRHRRLARGDWVPGLRAGDEYVPDARWSEQEGAQEPQRFYRVWCAYSDMDKAAISEAAAHAGILCEWHMHEYMQAMRADVQPGAIVHCEAAESRNEMTPYCTICAEAKDVQT